jgi:hypothetical protein
VRHWFPSLCFFKLHSYRYEEGAWRGKVEAASAAEVAAKSALEAKQAEASAAAEQASRERCQNAAAAVESGELRGKLQVGLYKCVAELHKLQVE